MFPKNGATDVSATLGNAVMMYFSEPVKFNTSGIISIKNSTNHEVGKVNLTSDAIAISPATNATKIPIPAVLVKGQKFTVSIPTGLIKDLAGNALTAISKSFTCLAETAETSAPVATGMSIDATANMIDVFFSKDVMMGASGTVSAVGSGVNIQTPITHSNVTVSGFKVSLSVYAGSLSSAGTYDMRVSAGSLKDAAGNLFRGLNGSSMTYVTSTADTTAPTLLVSQAAPPHESSPSFALPLTTSMRLTFSEAVQAVSPSSTAATLYPVFSYKQISISTADVYIDQATVVLTGSALMPGESYRVALHSGAFMDMSGNQFAGLASGYTISTRASMGFAQVSSGNWDALGYFDGTRYGSCAFVDPANVLYIIGGVNGTAGASTSSMMNDVWSYASKRENTCASSLMPYSCQVSSVCLSDTTLGSQTVSRTVWRAPSANGAPCTGMSGTDTRDLWATVETTAQSCSCPMCLTPPAGTLPTHMANESYVSAYTLVSAASGTAPLVCAPGKLPNGSFTCGVDTPYIGKFSIPYPNCYPAPCTAPPITTGILKFTALTTKDTDGGMNCSNLNSTYSMVSGGICAITCASGFTMAKGFECFEGTFKDAVCIPLTPCSQTSASVTNGAVECAQGTTAEYGETCPITCKMDLGYSPYASGAVATCDVSTGGAMSFVAPTGYRLAEGDSKLAEVCVPTTCTPPVTPLNAIGFSKSSKTQDTFVDDSFSLTCAAGYVVDVSVAVSTSCQKSGLLSVPLPVCIEAAGCDGAAFAGDLVTGAKVTQAAGAGTCVADMKDGDDCQLGCAEGFQPVGNFVCNNGAFTGILNCLNAADAAKQELVVLMASAFGLVVDLTGMDDTGVRALFTSAIGSCLGIETRDVATVDIGMGGRRLAGERRLQAGYEVAYQAVIPDNLDAATIAARASGIGAGGASQDLFLNAFSEAGVTVDASSLKVTQAPKTFSATIVRGADGVLAPAPPPIPTPPPPTPAPTPPTPPVTPTPTPTPAVAEKEEDSNVGAIIGGVVGGLVALLLIGGAAYYFLVIKKKQTE